MTSIKCRKLVCLPALGLCVTAVLLLFVSGCLLAKTEVKSFDELAVRTPAEKKDGDGQGREKDKDKDKDKDKVAKGVMIGARPAVELGSMEDIGKAFQKRSINLDVQTRTLSFLATWSVLNIIQGAAAIFVLALAGRIFWSWCDKFFIGA